MRLCRIIYQLIHQFLIQLKWFFQKLNHNDIPKDIIDSINIVSYYTYVNKIIKDTQYNYVKHIKILHPV